VTIAFLMLKNNEPYRYARPETVKAELAEARRKAGRNPEEARADAPLGALGEAYRKEGLRATVVPEQTPARERRALEKAEVAAFAEEVRRERRKAKGHVRTAPAKKAGQSREMRKPGKGTEGRPPPETLPFKAEGIVCEERCGGLVRTPGRL
jgi:transposase